MGNVLWCAGQIRISPARRFLEVMRQSATCNRGRGKAAAVAVLIRRMIFLVALVAGCKTTVAIAEPGSQPLDSQFFVGTWETRNIEDGRDVTIRWILKDDGSLAYEFVVDGVWFPGSSGRWTYGDGTMTEEWHRPDGLIERGTGAIEKIDDATIRLRILDNGDPSYEGRVRIYRRIGRPQIS